MADLTTDQIAIRNLCIKLQGYIAGASMTKTSEDLIETSMKLVCNTLIDVNRIADALDSIAGDLKVTTTASVIKAGDVAADTMQHEALVKQTVIDFGMWLTTRKQKIEVGAETTVYAMNEAISEYTEKVLKGRSGG